MISKVPGENRGVIGGEKYNFYDRILSLLIAFQIFGVYGGALQPIRIFIIILIPSTLVYLAKRRILARYRYESGYFTVFLVYAIIMTLFVNDQVAAIKELSYLVLNFSSFFVIIYLSAKSLNPKKSIINGWILLFILTIPIALVEVVFDYHLPVSVLQSDEVVGGLGDARRFASITFGNYNGYNVILVYTFPFLAASLILRKKFVTQLFTWFIVLVLFFLVITNASRGSLLCISITVVLFLFYYLKSQVKGKYFFAISLSSVVAFLVINYFNEIFTVILYRLATVGIEDNTRSLLISNSLMLLSNSYFFGVGTGNFQSSMSQFNLDTIAPHNFFLEIAVQYGLLIFAGFMILLIRLYKNAKKGTTPAYRFIVFTSLLVYPVASIINSSYIANIAVWIQLSSLFIIADPKFAIPKK